MVEKNAFVASSTFIPLLALARDATASAAALLAAFCTASWNAGVAIMADPAGFLFSSAMNISSLGRGLRPGPNVVLRLGDRKILCGEAVGLIVTNHRYECRTDGARRKARSARQREQQAQIARLELRRHL